MGRAPLRILHVGKFLPPSFGGMERALDSMSRGMADRGHEIRVLVHRDAGGCGVTATDPHFVTQRAPYRFAVGTMPLSWAYVRAYRRWSRWADIVHFHEPFPPASLAFCLLPKPARTVVSWHSDIVRQRFLRPMAEIFQRGLCRRAARIICSTAHTRDDSRLLKPWRSKVEIIGFGLDATASRDAGGEVDVCERLRQRIGGRYILAVGRLVSYKGFEILLRALALTDARLVIVGTGPLEDDLKRLSSELGLAGRVVFAGGVEDSELARHYAACDVFVLPSISRAETFGIVQIEAMACGKPVINTALPTGVPEVSLDGVTGITVPPGDVAALAGAIARLWGDAALRMAFGAQAQARVERLYTAAATTSALERLYRAVMAEMPEPGWARSGSEPGSRSMAESAKPSKDNAQIV